jgi:hypothetical protein
MKLPIRGTVVVLCLYAILLIASPASAQNWSFDARNIGMGGVGSTSNVAVDMIDEQRPYRALVLPFGLFQVLPNLPKLDPTKDDFDLVRAIEYAASPIHYIIGRDDTSTASAFITDLRNGELNRDLTVYRGFSPATDVSAEGLASPNWGHTFKFKKGDNGAFQGIYAGAGLYFSMKTAATIDPALAEIFASPDPIYKPNTSFFMSNDTESQFGMAVTGGYRARFALPGGMSGGTTNNNVFGASNEGLEGLYVGVNFHYLHGFEYERFQPNARLDTDAQGKLFVNLSKGFPVTIDRTHATSGSGFSTDFGVSIVSGHWQAGVGVNGIGNRIVWTGAEQTRYVLDSLFTGGEFNDLPTVPVADVRVELPVDTRGNVSYNSGNSTIISEFGHGFNGTSFRAGGEQRFGRFQVRGGARYIKERWEPTGGAGFNFTDRFGIDCGLFSTSANLERRRHLAIAFSLRFMAKNP